MIKLAYLSIALAAILPALAADPPAAPAIPLSKPGTFTRPAPAKKPAPEAPLKVELEPLAGIVLGRLAASEEPACVAVGTIGVSARVTFGCTKGAGPARFDRDSLFEVGSISKAFTGVVLADMVRKGEVALSDPVSKHARAGAKLPARGGREITLNDLATHTSGLPRLPPGFVPRDMANPYATFTVDNLYEALARTELDRDIGSRQDYSNFGYMFLAELLGRRAGKPFDELLAERVLAPLGMTSSHVRVPEALKPRLVQGHGPGRAPVSAWDLDPALSGVGGLRSSLLDMMRFAEAAAGRKDSALRETFELSFTRLRTGADNSGAFGWVLREKRSIGRLFWHNGGTGGFRSMLVVNPDAKTAAVVLSDGVVSFDDLALHLVDPTLPLKKKRDAIALTPATIDEYAGRFELNPGFVLRIYREGDKVMSQATGQGPIEIFAEAPDRFFVRVIDAQITFRRDAQGRIEGLTLHQGGRDIPGRKLP